MGSDFGNHFLKALIINLLADVVACGSVPATPDYCSVTLPNGQFVGGIECGYTAEGQVCTGTCQLLTERPL